MDLDLITSKREALQEDLKALVADYVGPVNTYYEPPENIRMTYPCFVLNLDNVDTVHSDNRVWNSDCVYSVTFMSPKVYENVIPLMVKSGFRKYVRFNRKFTSDSIQHYVFTVHDL